MRPRVVILGGGVGGMIVANRLVRRLRPDEAEVIVIDATGQHFYQPGLLYFPLNDGDPGMLVRPVRRLLDRRVQLLEGVANTMHPAARTVQVDGSTVAYDWLVLATGTRLVPERIPGFAQVHHFYALDAAMRLREALKAFNGGRIVIGPSRKVYKCPPAPLEFVLLLDDHLRRRRLRDRADLHYISPFPEVFQGKKIAHIMSPLLAARGVSVTTGFNVKEISAQLISSHEGQLAAFDLAVLVPPHRVAAAIEAAGLAPDGWYR